MFEASWSMSAERRQLERRHSQAGSILLSMFVCALTLFLFMLGSEQCVHWFVVPVFALPLLTKAQALGLSLLVGYITWQYTNTNSDSESGPWKWFGRAVGLAIFRPLLVLAISWVVHLFL